MADKEIKKTKSIKNPQTDSKAKKGVSAKGVKASSKISPKSVSKSSSKTTQKTTPKSPSKTTSTTTSKPTSKEPLVKPPKTTPKESAKSTTQKNDKKHERQEFNNSENNNNKNNKENNMNNDQSYDFYNSYTSWNSNDNNYNSYNQNQNNNRSTAVEGVGSGRYGWLKFVLFLVVIFAVIYFFFFRDLSASEVSDKIQNSTFSIYFNDQYSEDGGQGTGVVVGDNGLALTAFHCVNLYNGSYSVEFGDGTGCKVKELVAVDPNLDLALIRLENDDHKVAGIKGGVPSVGSKVYALGNSEGTGLTFSQGIISAVKDDFWGQPLISHTASISPGNSGGPLVDSRGDVVGINISSLNFETTQNLNQATLTSKLSKFVDKNKNSKTGANDKVWGKSFAKKGTTFLATKLDEKYSFYSEFKGNSYNGLAYEENLKKEGAASYTLGDYKNGKPNGFIYRQVEDNSEFGYTTYLGAYNGKNPIGKVLEYGDEINYLSYDLKSKLNGFYLAININGFTYGNMKNGKLDGYVSKGTDGSNFSTYKFVNGKGKPYKGLLPLLNAEDLRYKVHGKNLVTFDFTPMPGAKYYAIYYADNDNNYKPIKEKGKNTVRIFKKGPIDDSLAMNSDKAAPLQKVDVKSDSFNFVVIPLTSKANIKKYTSLTIEEQATSEKRRTVYFNSLKLPGSYYEIFTSNRNAYPYTYAQTEDLGPSNFLGLAMVDTIDDYSIFNKFGILGNDQAARSIYNKNGIYGSKTSNYSAYNPNATNPPKLYTSGGRFVAYLTKNKDFKNSIDPDDLLTQLMAG